MPRKRWVARGGDTEREMTRRRRGLEVRVEGSVRRSAAGILAAICCACSLLRNVHGLYELCTESVLTVEDGVCDAANNIASCEYDGGDCCPSTCSSSAGLCTQDTRQCLNPAASDYPYAEYGNCTAASGILPYIQDGICDRLNNNHECGYDGGDCCPSTCISSASSYCPEDTFECVDVLAVDFGYPGYENCSGFLPNMGNGLCNVENNNAECAYDGGDCCECSCQPVEFLCAGKFDCLDPEMNATECATTTMCSADLPTEWVVEDTAGAVELANAINCTGGVFNVEWRGHVNVTQTLWISDLTTVNITGVSVGTSPAIADGGGQSRIFNVFNASLHMDGMTLTQGHATAGGAVYIFRGTVTFSGGTSLINNSADENGGAVHMHGGVVSWDGDMIVADNSCASGGGAIVVRFASSLSWSGNTTFVGNRIGSFGIDGGNSFGGAIYALTGSMVSWTGTTRFVDNRVDVADMERQVNCYGGAVAVGSNSSVTWDGNTTFEDNEAYFCGGALHANESGSISWTGDTTFSNNRATRGGAVCLELLSSATWSGSTTFVGNNVSENGGAIYSTDFSSLAGGGQTTFESNTARDGGAVHVSGSSAVSWQGETSFQRNGASGSGGALFVGDGAEVSWTGRMDFSHNSADMNGGAVVSALVSAAEESAASILINGSVLFYNNSCLNYGGAVMVSGPVSLSFSSEDTQFQENSAGSAGGAICLTGVGTGPVFPRAHFVSNSAQIGGAVYSTGSGTAISSTGEEHPVTYVECNFTGNAGLVSGGAVESAAGKDLVVNSTFVGNTAGQGGAMTLAGSASLTGGWFTGNMADPEGGPAISNVGFTEKIESCSFSDNNVRCTGETFLDYVYGDRYAKVCSGCDTCLDCDVANSTAEPTCTTVPENTRSNGNAVLETLLIDSGYWRATSSSRDILACHNADACLGGETGAADFCAEGYEGPYCAVCSEGYAESLSYTCTDCSDRKATVVAFVALPVAVIAGLAFLTFMVSKEGDAPPVRRYHRLKQLLPLQSLKIVIVVWQILTELASVVNVSFPDAYERFLEGADVLNFDIGWVLSAGCFVEIDFHDRVITSTVGPIAALAVLGMTYAVAWCRNRSSHRGIQKVRRKHVSVALWVTFLVYSSVSSTLFKTFSCETLDDGKTYLRADYSIECDSSKHQAMIVYAALMVFVYPLGIPLVYAALLFLGRDALKIAAIPNREMSRVQAADHLSSPYRPGCFYYEIIECGRRVLLTGVIVFAFPNEPGQVAVTLVIACVFALIYEALAPYDSRWDAWISRCGHVIVLLSIFVAFLLEQDVSEDTSGSQDLYGGVLLAINVVMVFAVVVQGVSMTCSVTRPAEPLPRSVSLAALGFGVDSRSDDNAGRDRFGAEEDGGNASSSRHFRSAVVGFAGVVARNGRSVAVAYPGPSRSRFASSPQEDLPPRS